MCLYYELIPSDTLFFRGAEPLEAGQIEGTVVFPPPVTVISGAFRTAVLKKNEISFKDYNEGRIPEKISDLIGNSDKEAPFSVTSFLLKKGGTIYSPAPYSWFVDIERKPERGMELKGKKILPAFRINDEALRKLAIKSSADHLPVVKVSGEALSLGGFWIRLEILQNRPGTLSENDVLTPAELYGIESRTGISLLDEAGRSTQKVKKSALFTAAHIRLGNDVTMIVGIDRDCGLGSRGVLTLGGERRICGYRKTEVSLQLNGGDLFAALSPVKAEENLMEKVFCTGKLTVTAGWNMKKRFHKPSESWFPAGSVFTENVNKQFVPLVR